MSLIESWSMKENPSSFGSGPYKVGVNYDDIAALSEEQDLVDGHFFVNKNGDFAVIVKQSDNAASKALTWDELQETVSSINKRSLDEHRQNGSTGIAATYMKAQIALLALPRDIIPESLPAADRFVLPDRQFALDSKPFTHS